MFRLVAQRPARSSGERHPSCTADLPRMLIAAGSRTTVLVGLEPDRHPAFLAAGRAGRLDVYFCSDGRSALELARNMRVDAWVIAGVLPDMVGLRLRSILEHRRRTATASPGVEGIPAPLVSNRGPVMFLVAGRQDEGQERRALEAGVHGYLVDEGPKHAAPASTAPEPDAAGAAVSPGIAVHRSQRRTLSPPQTRGSPASAPPFGGIVGRGIARSRPSLRSGSADVFDREPDPVFSLRAVITATGLVACV